MRNNNKIILIVICLLFIVGTTSCEYNRVTNIVVTSQNKSPQPIEHTETPAPMVAPTPEQEYGTVLDEAAVGFTQEKLEEIDALIKDEVERGFPGAVLLIAREGHIAFHRAYGYAKRYDGKQKMESPQTMQEDTLFDLASLTKFYGTAFAVNKLIDEGRLLPEDTLHDLLPGFAKPEHKEITVDLLLRHKSGYPGWEAFHNPKSKLHSKCKEQTLSRIAALDLEYRPGEMQDYSDIGYILLGAIVEQVAGQPLDQYVAENLYAPLGLMSLMYKPLEKGIESNELAATERMGNTRDGTVRMDHLRQYTLQGEVHDEIAYYCMDGVSGHAGLFGDTMSLAVLSQLLLNGGIYGDVRLLSEARVKAWLSGYTVERYGPGYANASHADNHKYFGTMATEGAIGHTGWTGTAMLIDPNNDLFVILLTNKRHSPYVAEKFEGDSIYLTGRYATIIEMVYSALIER